MALVVHHFTIKEKLKMDSTIFGRILLIEALPLVNNICSSVFLACACTCR